MAKRARAHEAGSVEAGRPAAHRFFFAYHVVGAVVGQPNRADSRKAKRVGFRWPARATRSDQICQFRGPGASRAARSSQPDRPGATRIAKSSEPGRAQQPDRASRGQIEPARTRQVAQVAICGAKSSRAAPNRAGQAPHVAQPRSATAPNRSTYRVRQGSRIGRSGGRPGRPGGHRRRGCRGL